MVAARRQLTAPKHLVLFDGPCVLCERAVRLILALDRGGRFGFASLDSAVAQELLGRITHVPHGDTMLVVPHFRASRPSALARSRAVLFIAAALGWPWKAAQLFRLLPTSLLDALYDIVATRRHRLFGRYDTCPVPSPEVRARFLDMTPPSDAAGDAS